MQVRFISSTKQQATNSRTASSFFFPPLIGTVGEQSLPFEFTALLAPLQLQQKTTDPLLVVSVPHNNLYTVPYATLLFL